MPDSFMMFSKNARDLLTYAQEEAQRFNHNYIGTEHLLLAIVRIEDCTAAQILRGLGAKLEEIRSAITLIISRGDRAVLGEIGLTPRSKKAIELAVQETRGYNHGYIGTEHLLLGLVREGEGIAAGVLESLGANLDRVRAEVERVHRDRPEPTRPRPALRFAGMPPSNQPPAFGDYGVDWTASEERSQSEPPAHIVIWTGQLVRVLTAATAANPVAAVAGHLALQPVLTLLGRWMAKGEVPDQLKGKRLISFSFASVVRGATTRREFERRLVELLAQAVEAGNCVLVVDEETALPDGEGGALAAAIRLKPQLAAGRLQCIVAASRTALIAATERDPELGAIFTLVDLRLSNGEVPDFTPPRPTPPPDTGDDKDVGGAAKR